MLIVIMNIIWKLIHWIHFDFSWKSVEIIGQIFLCTRNKILKSINLPTELEILYNIGNAADSRWLLVSMIINSTLYIFFFWLVEKRNLDYRAGSDLLFTRTSICCLYRKTWKTHGAETMEIVRHGLSNPGFEPATFQSQV